MTVPTTMATTDMIIKKPDAADCNCQLPWSLSPSAWWHMSHHGTSTIWLIPAFQLYNQTYGLVSIIKSIQLPKPCEKSLWYFYNDCPVTQRVYCHSVCSAITACVPMEMIIYSQDHSYASQKKVIFVVVNIITFHLSPDFFYFVFYWYMCEKC